MEALEVSRSLHHTFDSPATFGWIESCMVLQPLDVPRLLIGLEEVRDWIDSLQIGTVVADDSSYSFALNWCTTMEQVLNEYSQVLKMRTAEIYYLDFAMIFAAHGLTETYEKHGFLMRREMCSRFSTERIPRPVRKTLPLCRQLQMPSEASIFSLGFFIYEPNRDIYISSLKFQPSLFAQSASSGRQLPPLSDPEPRDYNRLLSYAISGDGNHLGLVYDRSFRGERQLSIVIWEIEATLDFTRRMQARPWARIVHKSTIEESIVQIWFHPCIAFDWDSVCITPNGLVRTAQGANIFIPDNPLRRLSEKINIQYSDIQRAFYSQNGKFLFIISNGKITKYSLPDIGVQFELSLSNGKRKVSMASPTGRYLAFVAPDQDRNSSVVIKPKNDTLLVDTLLGNTVVLPHSADPEKWLTDYLLHFSADEKEVIGYYTKTLAGPSNLSVYCYAGLPNEVRLRASGECTRDSGTLSTTLCVSGNHRTARIVSESLEIQRIKIEDKILFLDAPDEVDQFPFNSVFLSRDGNRWAGVYYGSNKIQVQIHTVLDPNETPRYFELQRTSSLSDDNPPFMTMSMDLSILVVDGDVYSLGDSMIGGLPMIQQTLKLPTELKARQSIYNDRLPQCSVDSSSSFVVYHTPNPDDVTGAKRPDVFALFRISFDDTSSTQLQPPLLEDMFDISSQFHPSIPLLIVGFGTFMSNNDRISFHVVMIDMETMSKHTVKVEQSPDLFSHDRLDTY